MNRLTFTTDKGVISVRKFDQLKKPLFYVGILVVLSLIIWVALNLKSSPAESPIVPETISYNKFLTEVENKHIDTVFYDVEASEMEFVDKNKDHYKVSNPRTDNFKEFLLKNDINVEETFAYKPSANSNSYAIFVVSFLIVGVILILIYKRPSTLPSHGVKPIKSAVNQSVVTFNDIAGYETTKKDVQYLIDFLKHPDKYKEIGARMPKGIIFYGPPGTGKTLCAKAISGEAGVPFFYNSGSDFVEMFVGVGAKRVRELFEKAKKSAPCIVFIDEIDAVGKRRGYDHNGEMDQTINALLTELDGFKTNDGVIVVGATNRLDILDDALIRPGRFDRHVAIPLPDLNERRAILNLLAQNLQLSREVNLEKVAKATIGFSGAGLDTLLNESAILAVIDGRNEITPRDIDEAMFKVIMKGDKKSLEGMKEEHIRLVAWHEAGHALIAKLLTQRTVSKVTIVPSTSGAGGATFISPEESSLYSQEDLIHQIKICYGGRIGEYLLTGKEEFTTNGASQDIQQATRILMSMIKEFGMTEELGLLSLLEFSGNVEGQILDLAKRMAKEFYMEALSLLKENQTLLQRIAQRLIEKETIEEAELDELISA